MRFAVGSEAEPKSPPRRPFGRFDACFGWKVALGPVQRAAVNQKAHLVIETASGHWRSETVRQWDARGSKWSGPLCHWTVAGVTGHGTAWAPTCGGGGAGEGARMAAEASN